MGDSVARLIQDRHAQQASVWRHSVADTKSLVCARLNPFSATRHSKRHQNKVKVKALARNIVHISLDFYLIFFFMVLGKSSIRSRNTFTLAFTCNLPPIMLSKPIPIDGVRELAEKYTTTKSFAILTNKTLPNLPSQGYSV